MNVLRDLFKDYRFRLSFSILCILLFYAGLSFFSPYDPTLWGEVSRDLTAIADESAGHRFQRKGYLLDSHLCRAQLADYCSDRRHYFKSDCCARGHDRRIQRRDHRQGSDVYQRQLSGHSSLPDHCSVGDVGPRQYESVHIGASCWPVSAGPGMRG